MPNIRPASDAPVYLPNTSTRLPAAGLTLSLDAYWRRPWEDGIVLVDGVALQRRR